MRNTTMTSTRGVLLMYAIPPSTTPPDPGPTLIAIIVAPELYPGAPHLRTRPTGVTRPQLLADGSGGRGARTGGTAHLISRDANAGATDEISKQLAREVPQGFLQDLVAAEQPVVTHDRRHGDEQTERGHAERLSDRA